MTFMSSDILKNRMKNVCSVGVEHPNIYLPQNEDRNKVLSPFAFCDALFVCVEKIS